MTRALVTVLGLALGQSAAAESAVFKGDPVSLAGRTVRVEADPLRGIALVASEVDGYALALPRARRWRVVAGDERPFSAETDAYSVTLDFVPADFDLLSHLAQRGVREPDWIDVDERAVLAWADPGGTDLHYWTTAPRSAGRCLLHLVWTPPADESASDDDLLDVLSRELDCRFDDRARQARATAADLAPFADEIARAAVGVLAAADGITARVEVETTAGRRSIELEAATPEQGLAEARRRVREMGASAAGYAVAYHDSYLREGRTMNLIRVEAARRDAAEGTLFAFPLRGRREPALTGYYWVSGPVRSVLE